MKWYQKVSPILNSRAALRTLQRHDVKSHNPWGRGGCYVFAEALRDALNADARVVGLTIGNGGPIHHAVVGYMDKYIDAAGAHTLEEMQRRYRGCELQPDYRHPDANSPLLDRFHQEAVGGLTPLLAKALDHKQNT